MVRAMCGVQLKDRKKSKDLIFMFRLNETIYWLAMANRVCWYGHVLRREDGHVLRREDGHVLRREDGHVMRRAIDFENEGERKKGDQRGHGENRLRKKV